MLRALSLLLPSLLGLAALALAMDRHHETLPRRWRGRFARRVLCAVGIAWLAASLTCAVVEVGGAQGVVLWLGVLTPSALAVVGCLAGSAGVGRAPSEARKKGARPDDS
jgi:hypothetical protein